MNKKWLLMLTSDQAGIALLITFFTILLGIVLSEIQNRVGWGVLTLSLLTVMAVYFVVLYVNVKYYYAASLALHEDIKKKLDNYIGIEKKGWILTVPLLVEFERNTSAPEIWLISGDLAEDIVGEPFFEVVEYNLHRGVVYRYFVPDKPEIRARIRQIKLNHSHAENIRVIYVSEDFFFLVPDLDFVIYNPYNVSDSERIAYMGLPVPGEDVHYEVRISDELVDVLIGKLIPLIKEGRG